MTYNDDPAIDVEVEIGTVDSPVNVGSNGSTFESGTQRIKSATRLSGTITSDDSASINVTVEWLNSDGSVRREQSPPPLQSVADGDVDEFTLNIKSNRFNLKVADASGSADNRVHGSAKAI